MATFAWLAYLPTAADIAVRLAAAGFKVVAVVDRAFLAVNHDAFAVLVFRGTEDLTDWGVDLNARPIAMPGFPRVKVHAGFWTAFEAVHAELKAAVDANVPGDLGLYIAGHSLGGALAQIAAAVLERDNLAACYTFGSPRVASGHFDEDVKCPNYRVINHWDLVPGVPLPGLFGYHHAGDPRLLAGKRPLAVLRRDHWLLAWVWAQIRAAVGWTVTHSLFSVDDHMIWNYQAQLEAIAREP